MEVGGAAADGCVVTAGVSAAAHITFTPTHTHTHTDVFLSPTHNHTTTHTHAHTGKQVDKNHIRQVFRFLNKNNSFKDDI